MAYENEDDTALLYRIANAVGGSVNSANPLTASGTIAATGTTAATGTNLFIPNAGYGQGRFNLTISGTWVGSFVVERSFDGGSTWFACTNNFAAVAPTANGSEVLIEPRPNTRYRINFTRTSGTLAFRFDQ